MSQSARGKKLTNKKRSQVKNEKERGSGLGSSSSRNQLPLTSLYKKDQPTSGERLANDSKASSFKKRANSNQPTENYFDS